MSTKNKNIRVNVRSRVDNSKIRHETRANGRKVIVVPSATMPDNVIMNGILYPAEEIALSFGTLERTHAPFGHPTINGDHVSAADPEAINTHYIGAWNENVRQENGRVLLDKIIDIEFAERTDNGKRLIEAINGGEAIHTSTGLFALMENAEGEGYEKIARSIMFDHDAILLDEEGAATPSQGVGMMVNSIEKILVINSSLEEEADERIDWALDNLAEAMERKQRLPVLETIKSALIEALGLSARETSVNQGDDNMSEKDIAALSTKVDSLVESIASIGTVVGNAMSEALKPLVDAQNAANATAEAAANAEKTALVNKLVEGQVLTEAVANTLSVDALKELSANTAKLKSTTVNGAAKQTDDKADKFALPAGE